MFDATPMFGRVPAAGAEAGWFVPARSPVTAGGGGLTHNRVPDVPASPGEEHTSERAPAVTGLDDEVLVVDEQPQYHLPGCCALDGLDTIALTAREAAKLEFVPCELCALAQELALVTASRQSNRTG
jgi:hypothetical protein